MTIDTDFVRRIAREHLSVEMTVHGRLVTKGFDSALAACGWDVRQALVNPDVAEAARVISEEQRRLLAYAEKTIQQRQPDREDNQ